jgi:hypothetical protein
VCSARRWGVGGPRDQGYRQSHPGVALTPDKLPPWPWYGFGVWRCFVRTRLMEDMDAAVMSDGHDRDETMRHDQLEHAIPAACAVSGDTELLVFGPGHPWQFSERTRESPSVDRSGHATHGFYVHGVSIEAATLPDGWDQRTVAIANEELHQPHGDRGTNLGRGRSVTSRIRRLDGTIAPAYPGERAPRTREATPLDGQIFLTNGAKGMIILPRKGTLIVPIGRPVVRDTLAGAVETGQSRCQTQRSTSCG